MGNNLPMPPIQAVKNVPLADQIFGQITAQILSGELKAGENLPAERSLAELFGVNRHVVREAVKRLQQAGLVQVVHGGGTRVLDIAESGGLELFELIATYMEPGPALVGHWLSVMELRVLLAGDIACKCALRGSAELRAQLPPLVDELRAANTDEEIYDIDERLWALIAEGSQNLAYQLAFNSMTRLASLDQFTPSWVAEEVRAADFQQTMVEAIVAGDAELADRLARATMKRSYDRLLAASQRSPEPAREA